MPCASREIQEIQQKLHKKCSSQRCVGVYQAMEGAEGWRKMMKARVGDATESLMAAVTQSSRQ